jgi:hypothetical protein
MLSLALSGRSRVISYHLQALGIYIAWLAIFAIVEKNHVLMK